VKPFIREWLLNLGMVLVGLIILAAAFSMRVSGQRAADDAAKALSSRSQK